MDQRLLEQEVILIAAVSDLKGKRVIGANGTIPWFSDSEIRKPDMERFRDLTFKNPVVMGRATLDSMGKKPLPCRTNIVISNKPIEYELPVFYHARNEEEALRIASHFGDTVYIIGGGRVYSQYIQMPQAKRLEITEIKEKYDGDVYFPPIDESIWKETARIEHEKFNFLTFEKR